MDIRPVISRLAHVGCALLACLCAPQWAVATDHHIVLLNWSEYIDPEIVEQFTSETGIEVKPVYFASDSDRDARIAQADAGEFDVVVINGPQLDLYRNWGWLAPMSTSDVPNIVHLDRRWIEAYPDSKGYAIPYFWGTIGIAYRRDLIATPITSWSQIFHPDASLCGKFPMPPDVRQMHDLALFTVDAAGHEDSAAQLEMTRRILLEQKPCVQEYVDPDLNERSQLISGEQIAAILYSGDALFLSELDPRIEFVIPAEGTLLWSDYLVVPDSSRQKDAAFEFINFLNRPDIAARLADYLYYATPNLAAKEHLSEDYLRNAIIFPGPDVLQRARLESEISSRDMRKLNAMAMEVLAPPGDSE